VDLLLDDEEDTLAANSAEAADTEDVPDKAPSTDDIDTDDLGKK
jgi:hypothetical protein